MHHLITSYNQVYYVETEDQRLGKIAIRPHFFSDRAEWEDTSKGKILFFDHLITPLEKEAPNEIKIQTSDGIVTLSLLTLDIYNKKIKPFAWGSPSFSSDQELREYYLNTHFSR